MEAQTERVLLTLEARAAQHVSPRTPATVCPPNSPVAPPRVNVLEFEHFHTPILNACIERNVLPKDVFRYSGGPTFVARSSIDALRLMLAYESNLCVYDEPNPDLAKTAFFALLVCTCLSLSKAFLPSSSSVVFDAESIAKAIVALTAQLGRASVATQTGRLAGSTEFEAMVMAARVAHRIATRADPNTKAFFQRVQRSVMSSRVGLVFTRGAVLESSRLFAVVA